LLTWLLASLGLLWLAVGCSVYVVVRRSLEGRFDAELRAMASEVRYLLPEGRRAQSRTPSAYWLEFFQKESGMYFEVWDEYLVFSDRSPSLGSGDLPRPASFEDRPRIWNFNLSTGERVRGLAQRMPAALPLDAMLAGTWDGLLGTVNVVVARNRDALDRSIGLLVATTGLAGVLIFPVSFLIVRLAVGRGMYPLRAFADRVASIGFESLRDRFQTAGVPDELQPVAQRLNELMDRLEAGIERERRLNADLAHELRTPVAELRTMTEVALAWPDKIRDGHHREVLDVAKQMQSIIDSMLVLAQCDRGAERPSAAPVDISGLVRECRQSHVGAAAAKRLEIREAIPEGTTLRTNEDLLRIVLGNLIANAVAHSPTDGIVSIEGRSDNGRFVLTVANPAGDIAEEDLPRMFDRFWRRDKARGGAGHAGLGLALARSCAEIMGLDLCAELNRDDGTIVFRVSSRPSVGADRQENCRKG
jgi:two-component system sensor histidine kinase QseC